jgi:hypothetical protein
MMVTMMMKVVVRLTAVEERRRERAESEEGSNCDVCSRASKEEVLPGRFDPSRAFDCRYFFLRLLLLLVGPV